MPSVAMNESICATSTSKPLMQAGQAAAGYDDHHRQRPGNAVPHLQADGENVPHDDAEADGEIDAAGHHRQGRGQRQHGDDRLVARGSSAR